MTVHREAFPPAATAGVALALAGAAWFAGSLARPSPFAGALLCLVLAAALGPCLFAAPAGSARWRPAAVGALRAAAFGVAALAVGGVAGPFAGLYAFAAGAAAYALGGGAARVVVAAAALALLATLFYWDDLFLRGAADRKTTAALAFWLNPAAAASVSLDFDWIHAKGLYTGNQTAESLVGVPLHGIGWYAPRLGGVALACAAAGLWRRP